VPGELVREMMGPRTVREEEAIVRRSPRAVFRELADGSGVLLHLDSTAYYAVNGIGVLIWSLLEDHDTITGIARELRARLEGTPPDLEADVAAYVGELRARGLVLVEPDES
jgi:hypothetical protein